MSGIWALVPFKGSDNAKQRLRDVLTAAERQQARQVMQDTAIAVIRKMGG